MHRCMRNIMDIFSLMEELGGEVPKTKSERNSEFATNTKEAADGDIDLDKDIEDLSVQDKQTKKGAAKSSSKGDDTKVEAPVTCIGEHFKVILDEADTVKDCVNQLVRLGYKEVLAVKTCVPVGKSMLLFKQANTGDPENRRVDMPVTICAGENRMELTADDFPDYDPDEISVGLIKEKWAANNPAYEGCGLIYEPKCAVATPALPEKKADMKKEYELPMKVSVFGEVVTITNDDLGIIGLASGKAISEYLCYQYLLPVDKAELLFKDSGEMVFADYSSKMKGKGISFDRTEYYVKKDAVVSIVTEKYVLPFTLYMANFNYSILLTSGEFGGRNKVEQADVLKIAAKYCPTLQSADRKADVLYLKDKNIVSVAAVSGKKGL